MTEKVWLAQYPPEIPHKLTYEDIPVQAII